MHRVIVYLLFFFIAFTHSAVAMDIHASNILGQKSATVQEVPFMDLSDKVNIEDHNSLNEHCPHSSSHTSGIITSIALPLFETHRVFISFIKTRGYTISPSPLLRPPKA